MWVGLHSHYQDGHLLVAGGIGTQPAKYLQAMRIVQSEMKVAQDELDKDKQLRQSLGGHVSR